MTRRIWGPASATAAAFAAAMLVAGCQESQPAMSASVPEAPAIPQVMSGTALGSIPQGVPVDEEYRREFERCDRENIFRNQPMTGFRRCSGDPNRLTALNRLHDGTISFDAKLGLDIDGGFKALTDPGLTDLRDTSYRYPDGSSVYSDTVPYVVIPQGGDFSRLTGIQIGDIGVVLDGSKAVPVLVADRGPANKIGEGSIALFEAIGDSRCRTWQDPDRKTRCSDIRDTSLNRNVRYLLFPDSKISGLTPDTVNQRVGEEALRRFEALKTTPPGP
ncbi:glycoside hydrolase family 75 protein [Inquilinus sp. YAF38]|uniref:hypothetical protein n=1 Tax=Inquilinus sp. YAF38 TaxID=3233084 RepID=UPI003F929654